MQIEDPHPRWGILVGLLLILGALAVLPFLLFKPKPITPFQVRNFVGKTEYYSPDQKRWEPLRRGSLIKQRDKIRTGKGGEADLQIPDQFQLRVKENSEVEARGSKLFDKEVTHRIHLLRGRLIGSTDKKFKNRKLEISTPVLVAAVRGTEFQVESNPEVHEAIVGVLRGVVEVRALKTRKWVLVRGLERTEVKGKNPPTVPVRVTRQEWDQLKEAYDLIEKSTLLEARQLDLSKEVGNLFQYVFDQGTFYMPKFGFAEREFIKDESTGKVYLTVDYDVFPVGSFVGMYIKTRNFDISKFQSLSFQVRGDPELGYPDSFRVELKSASGVVRLFVPRDFKQTWQTYQFPLRFNQPTLITEITIVISNEKAGSQKKGTLYLRDLTLEPLKPASSSPASTATPPHDTTPRSEPSPPQG